MNIFEYAMQMEKDGESYYRRLIQKTGNKGIKKILTMLADDEVRHYYTIQKMQTGRPQFAQTTVLDNAKNVFVQMKESDEKFDLDAGEVEFYRKAQDIEKKSGDFYQEKAGDKDVEEYQREIFLKLAGEEKKHYLVLENIIQFISRPQQWLENAEWYHLDEY